MEPNGGRRAWTERTAADLASLLGEVTRALKGLRFYEGENPARRDLLDRAYLAVRVELERSGDLEIELDDPGFRAVGTDGTVGRERLRELVEALTEHELERVRLTPELGRKGFHLLLELLAEEPRRLASRGGLVGALSSAEDTAGIALPGMRPVVATGPAARDDAPVARDAPVATVAAGADDDPNDTTQPMGATAPPGDAAGADAATAARGAPGDRLGPSEADDESEPDLDLWAGEDPPPLDTDEASAASLGSALLVGSRLELEDVALPGRGAPTPLASLPDPAGGPARDAWEEGRAASAEPVGANGAGFEDFTKPTLEEDPLSAPASSEADEALRRTLVALDGCTDDERYEELAAGVAAEAIRLADEGYRDATYRAVLVFADHAVGMGGRSGRQALASQERLEALCRNGRLGAVMDRACDPEGSVSIRAAQVLLQLGGRAVAPLLDRLVSERDDARAAQIRSIVIALGERAAPVVVAAIRGDDPRRARVAVRLAGELQSSHLVPTLVAQVDGAAAPDLRRDALRSLARIGGPKASDAVRRALSSQRTAVAETAAVCLGEMGQRSSVRPLMDRLDDAVAAGEVDLARCIVGALGALGAEEAVPKLVALVERRSLFQRSIARSLRVPALEALGRLPGREAWRAVERAARHRDGRTRQVAERILARARARRGGEGR